MKSLLALAFALLLPAAALAADSDQQAEHQATDSAKAWLALVDAGNYAESRTTASTAFQKTMTAEKWAATIKPVREPLGAVVQRHPAGVVMQTSGFGGREGALVFFTTTFANSAERSEKLTMTMQGGSWKVVEYTIK